MRRLPVKGCQIRPTAQAVPYKGWQQGATIAISPLLFEGSGALWKILKRPPRGTRRTRTELQEEEHEGLELFLEINCEPTRESHSQRPWAASQTLHCLWQTANNRRAR